MNGQRTLLATVAAVSTMVSAMLVAEPALAQNAPADTAGAAASTTTTAPTKAQRKQARKDARARRNAELSKLEKNGYNPATGNDANYPEDIQNAEKKANAGQSASQ